MRGNGRGRARAALAALLALAVALAGVPARGVAEAVEEMPAAVEDASDSSGVAEASEGDALSVEGEAVPKPFEESGEGLAVEASDEVSALAVQSATVADPRVVADSSMDAGQRVTWDCVWLGSYPQSVVTDAATISALDAASGWSASGDLTYGGATYRRLREADATGSYTLSWYWDWGRASAAGYCYFLWEPVKWRVLEADGSTALAIADVALDDQRYNATDEDGAWETCTLRVWLGQTFRGDALTPAQRGAVVPQTLANEYYYGRPSTRTTTDDVFLLASSDAWSEDAAARHGFAKTWDTGDEARRCKASDYAYAMGASVSSGGSYDGNCYWWLRSPGFDEWDGGVYAASVNYDGCAIYGIDDGYVYDFGRSVVAGSVAVRPALRVSLSSDQVYCAGTVCSDGTVDELAAPYTGTPGGGIALARVGVPKGTDRTYNGEVQVGVAAGEGYVLSGTFSARDTGTYTAVATPDAEHCWEDGTTDPIEVRWTIARAPVAAPAAKSGLTYTGKAQTGVAAGAGYTLSGTAKATNAGAYTATATPDANHCWADGTAAAKSIPWSIAKAASSIKLADQSKTYTGKAIAYSGKVTRSGSAGKVTYKYYSDAKCAKAVKAADVKGAGTYYVKATLAADANHNAATSAAAKLTVAKAAQPMKVKSVKRTAKASKLKKKAVTVAAPLKFTKKARGKVTYARVAKGSAKCLTVNKKTGKVTVKRGTKKGTYKVKIKVKAKGNKNYKAGSKTITCTVVVK